MAVQHPGSTGGLDALLISKIIQKWVVEVNPTSATWQTRWDNRSAINEGVTADYPIGYGRDNSSAGWYRYLRDVFKSTVDVNTTAPHDPGLPAPAWRTFATDIPGLAPDGDHASSQGRRVYSLITSSHTRSAQYRDPNNALHWLLCAWAAAGSSALGTS